MKLLTVHLILAASMSACLATAPIHPQAKEHNRAGVNHLQSGNLRQAAVCFQLSLEYNPCHAQARHNLALIHLMRGQLEAAEKYEREALECSPDLVQAVSGLGVIRKRMGEVRESLELFKQAVRMDPGYLDARKNLILTALELGEKDLAGVHLERLAVLSPADPLLMVVKDDR